MAEVAALGARCGSDMADLEIAALSVGEGTLAIASLPGRGGDLKGDLALFGEFKPSLVLTMVTAAELEGVGVGGAGAAWGWGRWAGGGRICVWWIMASLRLRRFPDGVM